MSVYVDRVNIRYGRMVMCHMIADTEAAVGQMEPSPPRTHRQAFELLWREINGAESWEANPFVWAIKFRRVEAQEGSAT